MYIIYSYRYYNASPRSPKPVINNALLNPTGPPMIATISDNPLLILVSAITNNNEEGVTNKTPLYNTDRVADLLFVSSPGANKRCKQITQPPD